MEGHEQSPLSQISGGEPQRAFIAMILARNLDRLLVIRQGQLLADGLPAEILTQQLVQQTFDLDPRFQVVGIGG